MLFVQVLPSAGLKAWMSARHSPACAVLDSGHLVVLGGFNAVNQPVGIEACLTFSITRCSLAAVMECVSFQGGRPPALTSGRHTDHLAVAARTSLFHSALVQNNNHIKMLR